MEHEETRESLEARYQRALDAAGRQLSYRALSVTYLKKKLLEKGHAEDAVEYAAAWLEERGLLDDAKFAESMVRDYTRKGYGVYRIRHELRRHGIGAEQAEAALVGLEIDLNRMVKLLDKRLHGDLSNQSELRKATAALRRRGYRWSDVQAALNAYGAQLEESP